jgi:hypothetical protein
VLPTNVQLTTWTDELFPARTPPPSAQVFPSNSELMIQTSDGVSPNESAPPTCPATLPRNTQSRTYGSACSRLYIADAVAAGALVASELWPGRFWIILGWTPDAGADLSGSPELRLQTQRDAGCGQWHNSS